MIRWQLQQITYGTEQEIFHSHSYYDIGVFDSASRRIAAHRMHFAERPATPEDSIEIGVIDLEDGASWTTIGQSRAWSWQQGPMAQWIPGQSTMVWNDREGDRFVTRTFNTATGQAGTWPRPTYAIDPQGRFVLSLNMARLDAVRPGYGYSGGSGARLDERHPRQDGVWRQDLAGNDTTLILSLKRAVRFLMSRLGWRAYLHHLKARYRYWFNHVKISPDGTRFTIKLRFRSRARNSGWNDRMGVSLTCGTDGKDLRLLTNATSHVIWLDNDTLYLWRRNGFYLYADEAPEGRRLRQLAPELIDRNVHLRYFPGSTERFMLDTPYREDIDLFIHNEADQSTEKIAHFENHRPKNGQYRCDLHPCPSPDGQKIVVTSLHDGGRQIYVLRENA